LSADRVIAPQSLADWLAYLERIHPSAIDLGLGRVSAVRDRLDLAPAFPIITVGGTNGKGSVCAMIEAVLSSAGYHVGLYTSPHLLRYNERIRVARREVDDGALALSFGRVESARAPDSLTYFEFGTLAAMDIFIRSNVDVAVLEVGLGGRLDAVNVFDADCTVVNTVDFDHMEYLGPDRESIGREKAGIFRAHVPAVFGDEDPPASLTAHAADIGAPLFLRGRDYGFNAGHGQWQYWSLQGKRSALPYPALRGAYQLANVATALAALDQIKDRLPVDMGAIRRGLVEVDLPGRFQVMPGRPLVILDVGHNPHAARGLAESLRALPTGGRVIAVGTTTLRALESAGAGGRLVAGTDETRLFVVPGYRFNVVERLVTNFHLPKSTLLMLVSAFAGREAIRRAYEHAVAERYRFFSYGDCMLIV